MGCERTLMQVIEGGPGRIYVKMPDGELKFLAIVDAPEFVFVPGPIDQRIDPKHPEK